VSAAERDRHKAVTNSGVHSLIRLHTQSGANTVVRSWMRPA